MNQILVITNNLNYKNKKKYHILFLISIIFCILILFYLLYSFYLRLLETSKASLLKNKYTISTLYNNTSNCNTTLKLSNNISIIGSIDIPKINISYPIIENINKDLLKISVCKFYGPYPNRIGNLCIAGHNYKNNSMFSQLSKLNFGDSIYITDLNNTKLEYTIYDVYTVNENNLDCMNDTKNVEITLITCNNLNNYQRRIIKAKVKGT